jgi:hypothetical protein
MEASYIIAILLSIYAIFSSRFPRFVIKIPRIPEKPALATICISLCTLFALKTRIIDEAAHNFSHLPAYVSKLPILVIQSGDHYNSVDIMRGSIVETVCLLQSFLLFILAALLRRNVSGIHAGNKIIAAAAATLALLAFSSPSMESADLYAYIAQAQALPSAYHPGSIPLPGESAIINHIWGLPLWPSPYGPLWIALAKITTASMPTLLAQLRALRFLGVIAVSLCIALLYALRLPRWAQTIFAVNPMIYDTFVSEGHNDIWGANLVLTAALICRYSPFLAVLPAAAAGLIKLPFILIGTLAFTIQRDTTRRVVLALATIALSLSVSTIAGGPWYWHALRHVAEASPLPASLSESIAHITLVLLALGFLLYAVLRRRFILGAAWSIAALSIGMLSQYLSWAFPYALLAEEVDGTFLAALPTAYYLLNTQYEITPFFIILRAMLIAVPTIGVVQRLLRRQRQTKHASESQTRR